MEELMISEICADPERYIGSVITLRGLFQGWHVSQCQFPKGVADTPPQTRSDWLIRTGADCIYVTGGGDLNPIDKKNLGSRIELEAEVMWGEDRKIYLVYRSSRCL